MSHDKPGMGDFTPTREAGTPGRVRTCKPVRARELEPRACTDFATGADSPCLLVKGADCAGVRDAFAWRVVPVFPGFGRPGYLLA